MADLASDWGFQPFGDAPEYPGNEAAQVEEAGKRTRKTDRKRQRQLEELVAGVVRLGPAPPGGNPTSARSFRNVRSIET